MPNSHQHRVLVVDDDASCLDALVIFLRCLDFAAVGVQGGQAALDLLRAGARPCVVVTDAWMPDLDGWALVQAMQDDLGLADVPVVMVSGFQEHAARAVRAGVRAYLPKPTEPELVAEAVARYCRRVAPDSDHSPTE